MMNLTGDGTGLDMVTMPQAMREQVPTSNFFQRGGYERNPVAIRHNTVAKLLAITDNRIPFDQDGTATFSLPARAVATIATTKRKTAAATRKTKPPAHNSQQQAGAQRRQRGRPERRGSQCHWVSSSNFCCSRWCA